MSDEVIDDEIEEEVVFYVSFTKIGDRWVAAWGGNMKLATAPRPSPESAFLDACSIARRRGWLEGE